MEINFADGATIGKREEQQDYKANMLLPCGYMLYVLADGMGGQIGGAHASKQATIGVMDYFSRWTKGSASTQELDQDPIQALTASVHQANRLLTEELRKSPHMNGMGTTLVVVLLHLQTNRYWYVSVGDSPLYCFDQAAGLKRINANHAYYEQLLEQVAAGAIRQEDADNHPQRHAITSAIMGKNIAHIDTNQGQLLPSQQLLIASDGVQTLDDLPGKELEAVMRQAVGTELTAQVRSILQAVESAGYEYQDNTTLILVEPWTHGPLPMDELTVSPAAASPQDTPPTETIPKKTERIVAESEPAPEQASTPAPEPAPAPGKSKSRLPLWAGVVILLLLLIIGGLLAKDFILEEDKPAKKTMGKPHNTATSGQDQKQGSVNPAPVKNTKGSEETDSDDENTEDSSDTNSTVGESDAGNVDVKTTDGGGEQGGGKVAQDTDSTNIDGQTGGASAVTKGDGAPAASGPAAPTGTNQ